MVHLSSMVKDYTETLTEATQKYMRRNETTTFRRSTQDGHQLIMVGLSIQLCEVRHGKEVARTQLRMVEAVQTLIEGGGWERLQVEHI